MFIGCTVILSNTSSMSWMANTCRGIILCEYFSPSH
jgi:hypothetical protein